MEPEPLFLYSIHESPADSPGSFLVRRWLIDGTGVPRLGDLVGCPPDLEAARALVPEGLFRMAPHPGDVACLVETWL